MSRTLSTIYSEAVTTRNNYLQLTELDPTLLSTSKVSIMNLITYIVAVCIYSYENVLDLFQLDMVSQMSQRMNGTPDWYLRMAKLFQYDSTTKANDDMTFDEDNLKIEYTTVDEDKRIIEKASYQYDEDSRDDITLKVCKATTTNSEGVSYTNLDSDELTAFKNYIDQIKFVGTEINCISSPGDIVTITGTIYYDDSYITADQALENVKSALESYAASFDYNARLYYQKIIDVIQGASHISDIKSGTTISVQSYSASSTTEYTQTQDLTSSMRPYSGYITFLLEDGQTSTINTTNLTFVANSTIQ